MAQIQLVLESSDFENESIFESVENILAEIEAQVAKISSMMTGQAPRAMITKYTRQLEELFIQGEVALQGYDDKKNVALVVSADYLVDLNKGKEATSLRDRVMGEHEMYIGIIKKRSYDNAQIMVFLFADQAPVSLPPVVQNVTKKVNYSYQVW